MVPGYSCHGGGIMLSMSPVWGGIGSDWFKPGSMFCLAWDWPRITTGWRLRCWAGGHKGWLFITLILVMHSLNVGPSGDLQNMIKLCPCFSPLISHLILQPAQCVNGVTTAGAGVVVDSQAAGTTSLIFTDINLGSRWTTGLTTHRLTDWHWHAIKSAVW